MAKKSHTPLEYLVIDIEATCWADKKSTDGATVVDQISEIIEIGYARYNRTTNEIISHGSLMVKPTSSTVSKFCTDLTHITQDMVDKGMSLAEACEILRRDLNSKGVPWASFGDYDRNMFEIECKRKGIEYPFTPQHLNVKQMVGALTGRIRGLGGTLSALKMNFEGTHHRGGDDAYNIARIMQKLASIMPL